MRFYRYAWRASFPQLSEQLANGLPVASGACCVQPSQDPFNYPFPHSPIYIDGKQYASYELPDTDSSGRIAQYSYRDQRLHAALGAHAGLFLEKDGDSSELSELIRESLRYVQRLEVIIKDYSIDRDQPVNRVDWAVALDQLSQTDWSGELMRKPLIVDLAEKQHYPLKEIARGAKRVLRRKRDTERLSKAREFDKATLIRIAQLPGRTISEKAGPKQRIPAVKRFESTDTLENRVVEHFCRLSEAEWLRNERDEQTALSLEWQRLASGFVGLCKRVKRSDDFSTISKLTSPCHAPNYTLEQNTNYRAVWQGYRKLIKRQAEREECWAWARRVFLNRAYVYAAELYQLLFPEANAVHIPYYKHLRARLTHQYGLWFEPNSLPGPRIFRDEVNAIQTAYLLSPTDVKDGFSDFTEILSLNADAYITLLNQEHIKVCPVYAFVGNTNESACREAKDDLAKTYAQIKSDWQRKQSQVQLTKPLFLWCDFLGDRGLGAGQSDGVIQAGIPVYHEHWRSPESDIVEAIREEFRT
jgi:hypothetical protein